MSFTTVTTAMRIEADHITELQGALNGATGYGQAISLTNLNNSASYSLTVKNQDSTNGYCALFQDESDNTILGLTRTTATLGKKLVMTMGTQTSAHDSLSMTATWNGAAATFNALKVNVTNTASAAASCLLDLQVASTSKYKVAVSGALTHALGTVTTATDQQTITATWNGAVTFNGIKMVITNTSSGTASRMLDLQTSVASQFAVDISGNVYGAAAKWFIGDTADANMTYGLCISQAGADDEALAFKSSDTDHGMTDWAETDTYGHMLKQHATAGGLRLIGYSSATAAALLVGRGVTDVTTKSTAANGYVQLITEKKSGTGTAVTGADANLVVIRNLSTTRFIFDAEGSAHGDVEWTTYDGQDDVALLNRLDAAMTRDPIKTEFGRYLSDYREQLQAAKVVNFYDDGPRAMVNFTRLAMLHTGAIRQLAQQKDELAAQVVALKAEVQALRALPAA